MKSEDKNFYKLVMGVALPIMIQNGISNFVNLLDNLMIGRVGTNALSGVAISNQLIFIYYLLVFGASAGIGIFTAQYYGMRDIRGVRYTFRTKVIVNTVIALMSMFLLYRFGDFFVSLFLQGEGAESDVNATLTIGRSYLDIMLVGLIPIGITQSYAGTLRESGETKVPMYASFVAVFVNLIGNYLLIYGHWGLPAFGADGAAMATVLSRFVEVTILAVYTHAHSTKHPFIIGAFKNFYVPGPLWRKYLLKSLPLMLNEGLWSFGCTALNQSYSYRSLSAVAAINIENTIWNLLGVAFLAMGEAVGILVGQVLGTGDMAKAKVYAKKLTTFTVLCGVVFALGMAAISPLFPRLYNTTDEIRALATKLIILFAFFMPVAAYLHATYFIIRSGGRTGITMIFDSCFMVCISVPLAYFLSRYTELGVIPMMACVQSVDIVKCVIGYVMVRKGIWARNIVEGA